MKFLTGHSTVVGLVLFVTYVHTCLANKKIENSVLSKLAETSTVDIIVSMQSGTSAILQQFSPQNYRPQNGQSRTESIVSALQSNTEKSQKNVMEFLSKSNHIAAASAQSFWISNQIFLRNVDSELLSNLAEREDIAKIELNHVFQFDDPVLPSAAPTIAAADRETEWGVLNIQANKVWELPQGNAGEGVIVAIIDTGVMWDHEALIDNFMGYYGWYDPYDFIQEPYDANGHGTHVTGTIAGKFGIGVAPNATWMGCLGCGPIGCFSNALITCSQFIMCPTLADGTKPNCTKAAHIVNNSWSGGQGTTTFDAVVAAWHAAGIIPVVAIGNEGDLGCGSAGSPGDYPDVIGVGATTSINAIAYFSGRGPTVNGLMKPDISAPGFNVTSAWRLSNSSYATASGTSMACPHAAGAIALLKSAYPSLSYDDIKYLLYNGADTMELETTGATCGNVRDDVFPNHHFGYGKINILKSINILLNEATSTTTTRNSAMQPKPVYLIVSVISALSIVVFN